MKTLTFVAAILSLVSSIAIGQYGYLTIQHPQQTWRSGQGTIEEATLCAYQKGIYTQNDLYLTFSARGLSFLSSDSVEIQLTFTLPENSIVIDSWLLIDNVMVRSAIMDRWTASTIYESIVKRRRDPSVLYKDYSNYYQLRVYPLVGTSSRKVKISYLTRNDWILKSLISPLPVHIVRASSNLPQNFSVRCWPAGTSQAPSILEMPNLAGTAQTDSSNQTYYQFEIPGTSIQTSMNISFVSNNTNGIYVSRFQKGNDGIYQIALTPWKAFGINKPRKVALLFDFDPSKSTVTASDVLSTVRSYLIDKFSGVDSINLIFSGLNIHRLSPSWMGADSASIVQAFTSAGPSPFAGYGNLPSLLANGVDFIQSKGNEGVVWLIANTDQVGNLQASNSLLNDLMKLMSVKIPIHICDFNTNYSQSVYVNGQFYPGNQYFYDNLARLTNGSDQRIEYNGSLYGILSKSALHLQGNIDAFDIYTTLSNGFCYGRISIGTIGLQSIGLEQTIYQTGKFNGSFPMIIDVAGIVGDSVFSNQITVAEQDAVSIDSVATQAWAGNYISSLEFGTLTNDAIRQVIAVSLTNRVLTQYTAFLCLDPSDTIKVCTSCSNSNPIVISVEKQTPSVQPKDSLVQAFPNPFNSQTILNIRLPNGVRGEQTSLRIYNVLGQVVYSFPTSALNDRSATRITWNSQTERNIPVSSGVYFVMLSTPKGKFTTKLLLLK